MGKPYELRRHADAKRAYKMRLEGYTSNEIASAIGCKPEQVKSRVLLGERLQSAVDIKDKK